MFVRFLQDQGVQVVFIDARPLLITDSTYGSAVVNESKSKELFLKAFAHLGANDVPVVTGFIASNAQGTTTTLGRNGSNYSAALSQFS